MAIGIQHGRKISKGCVEPRAFWGWRVLFFQEKIDKGMEDQGTRSDERKEEHRRRGFCRIGAWKKFGRG